MLAIPPCGASSNIALWRAKIKPSVELVVGDLKNNTDIFRAAALFKKRFDPFWDSEMRAGKAMGVFLRIRLENIILKWKWK